MLLIYFHAGLLLREEMDFVEPSYYPQVTILCLYELPDAAECRVFSMTIRSAMFESLLQSLTRIVEWNSTLILRHVTRAQNADFAFH
jgi:hypothetical protein